MKEKRNIIQYLSKNILTVFALVLVWRGVWYVLDGIDYWLFDGYNWFTGLIGILIGILILYIPDKDLKEIEKL